MTKNDDNTYDEGLRHQGQNVRRIDVSLYGLSTSTE